jgi:hypothetical protein
MNIETDADNDGKAIVLEVEDSCTTLKKRKTTEDGIGELHKYISE